MFMTLAGELSWQRSRRSAIDFYSKSKKITLEPPFRAVRSNVRTPSMARWKARGRLYIVVIELFSLSPTVETLWVEVGRSRRFSKGGSLWAQISEGMGRRPPTTVGIRVIALLYGIKISAVRDLVLSQSTRVTDRQTDGQNYYSQDCPRSKNAW